jgi:hypothetical protein
LGRLWTRLDSLHVHHAQWRHGHIEPTEKVF